MEPAFQQAHPGFRRSPHRPSPMSLVFETLPPPTVRFKLSQPYQQRCRDPTHPSRPALSQHGQAPAEHPRFRHLPANPFYTPYPAATEAAASWHQCRLATLESSQRRPSREQVATDPRMQKT